MSNSAEFVYAKHMRSKIPELKIKEFDKWSHDKLKKWEKKCDSENTCIYKFKNKKNTRKLDSNIIDLSKETLDFINNSLSGLLKPDVTEKIVGSAEVQAIFKVSKVGKVAGSKVIDGEIANNLNARLIRDGNVLYTGLISSIFREKNATKQVSAGLECGITLKDFADFKEKDVIEVYKIIETERRI